MIMVAVVLIPIIKYKEYGSSNNDPTTPATARAMSSAIKYKTEIITIFKSVFMVVLYQKRSKLWQAV